MAALCPAGADLPTSGQGGVVGAPRPGPAPSGTGAAGPGLFAGRRHVRACPREPAGGPKRSDRRTAKSSGPPRRPHRRLTSGGVLPAGVRRNDTPTASVLVISPPGNGRQPLKVPGGMSTTAVAADVPAPRRSAVAGTFSLDGRPVPSRCGVGPPGRGLPGGPYSARCPCTTLPGRLFRPSGRTMNGRRTFLDMPLSDLRQRPQLLDQLAVAAVYALEALPARLSAPLVRAFSQPSAVPDRGVLTRLVRP
jgi:hypothetical protein